MENRPKVAVPINNFESYPNASMSAKSHENRERPTPVVSKDHVTMRKKSAWEKTKHRIFEQEKDEIKDHLFGDILIPALKDTVGSAIIDTVDILLYGEARHIGRGRTVQNGGVRYGNYVSYNSVSNNKSGSGVRSSMAVHPGPRNYMEMDDIYFESKWKANDLLNSMRSILADYSVISVADMYGLISEKGPDGVERPMVAPDTYNNYGWYDLSGADIGYTSYGWRLILPTPKCIR